MSKQKIHLCDFDGTLTQGDTLIRFLWFAVPVIFLIWGGIALAVIFTRLIMKGKWANERAKEAVMAQFFKGKSATEMTAAGVQFCQKKLPKLLREALLKTLREARQKGETVVIVSASADLWLRPFCTEEGFDLLCTELAYVSGKFNGQFATPNCNGQEKVRRIQAAYDLHAFAPVVAYGNSDGDEAMFELADEVFRF